MVKNNLKRGEIVIYQTAKREVELKVRLEKETVWLMQSQIALLFDTKRPAITKHLNNIFNSGELNKNSVCSILEQVAADGKIRRMNLYNLDMIISVFRVTNYALRSF